MNKIIMANDNNTRIIKVFCTLIMIMSCVPKRDFQKYYNSRRAGFNKGDFSVKIDVPNRNHKVIIEKLKDGDNKIIEETITLECDTSFHDYSDITLPEDCMAEAYTDCDEPCSYEDFSYNCDFDIDYSEYDDEVCDCFNLFLNKANYKITLYKYDNKLISSKKLYINKNTKIKL